jgi:Na+-driven multidrug efflux pump
VKKTSNPNDDKNQPDIAGALPAGNNPEPNAKERDLTRGSITGALWTLAWPMTVSTTIMMIGPIIDMIWIGKLGAAEMAGVGISAIVVGLVNSLIMGVFTGLRALVSRFVGAGDKEQANHVAQQAFIIGVALSLVMAVIG